MKDLDVTFSISSRIYLELIPKFEIKIRNLHFLNKDYNESLDKNVKISSRTYLEIIPKVGGLKQKPLACSTYPTRIVMTLES